MTAKNITARTENFIPSPIFGSGGNMYGSDFGKKLSIACIMQLTKNTAANANANIKTKIIIYPKFRSVMIKNPTVPKVAANNRTARNTKKAIRSTATNPSRTRYKILFMIQEL